MLKYDGTTLQGTINGISVKVKRSPRDTEDLEKACMMAILKHLGYTYADVQELQYSVKQKWIPKTYEKYYYVSDDWKVNYTYNDGYTADIRRIQAGNCFKTFKEAQDTFNRIKEALC